MKKVIVGLLAVLGLLSILAFFAVAAISLVALLGKPTAPKRILLEVDFERGVIESVPPDPFAEYMLDGTLEVRDVVDALQRGAEDSRVLGLIARVGGESMTMAHIEEVRGAVRRFSESGKPAVVFAETFGEFASGNGSYFLATAFDRIYLQPTGDVGLTGLIYESMFYHGLLDKLGLQPRMDQRYEFKNAMNVYTEESFTAAHREAMQAVMDSRFDQIVNAIAESRGVDAGEVRALADRGPFLGQEAVEAGLVDELLYRDEVLERLREETDERADLLYLGPYLERAGRPNRRGTGVALIHGHGAVVRGYGGYSPFSGEAAMGSASVAAAFRAARDDSSVKAVLFRVDSPGGSFVASDTIRREVVLTREAGIPVVVSMGNLAGSGGYYVAMEADRIVAQPSTITASIGVLGGKILTREFWGKLGITFDEVHTSENAEQWSPRLDYSEEGYQRFQDSLDRVYEDFTGHVAETRGIELERVLEIAKGRIWSGADALELGLVDELGGFHEALVAIRELLELEADASIKLKPFPRKRTAWEAFFAPRPDSSERAARQALRETVSALQPYVRMLHQAGVVGEPELLGMPDVSPLH